MDHIEKMAAECMKDLNEDEEEEADDEDLERDTDLLVCITLSAERFGVSLVFVWRGFKQHLAEMCASFVVKS